MPILSLSFSPPSLEQNPELSTIYLRSVGAFRNRGGKKNMTNFWKRRKNNNHNKNKIKYNSTYICVCVNIYSNVISRFRKYLPKSMRHLRSRIVKDIKFIDFTFSPVSQVFHLFLFFEMCCSSRSGVKRRNRSIFFSPSSLIVWFGCFSVLLYTMETLWLGGWISRGNRLAASARSAFPNQRVSECEVDGFFPFTRGRSPRRLIGRAGPLSWADRVTPDL